MKKLFLLLNIFSVLTTVSQWQTFYPVNNNITIIDVSVVNQNIIWAAGSYGTITKTTNGGQSWTINRLNDTIYPIWGISAVNEQIAWVASTNNRLYKTTNGGASWVEQYFSIYGIGDILFFNANTGMFVLHRDNPYPDTARMMITRNGGLNWYKNPSSPVTSILYFKSLGAIDTNFVWLIDNNKCYTLSGGLDNNWNMYSVDSSSIFLCGNSFLNSSIGYVCTGFPSSPFKIYRTTNSGVNWSQYLSDSALAVNTLCFIPNTNMAILNGPYDIRISRDNGLTWIHRIKYNYPLDSIDMGYMEAYDTNSIWITANKGRLLKYDFNLIGLKQIGNKIPSIFLLSQNYPNPFNPVTKIRFTVPVNVKSNVKLIVYDAEGREVSVLANKQLQPGTYETEFDGINLSGGVYFYKLSSGDYIETKKMILVK